MLAKHIIIKEIRLEMKFMLELVSELENTENLNAMKPLKVIYLVRDPRAIMASRYDLQSPEKQFCSEPKCYDVRVVCANMRQDIVSFKHLMKISHVSLEMHLLRFEDLTAIDPIGKSRQLFKQLSLPFTVETEKWVKEHTTEKTGPTYRIVGIFRQKTR